MTARSAWLAFLFLVVVVGHSAGDRPRGSVPIAIRDLRFAPETLRVAVGDTVVWSNHDIVPHTVDADGDQWTSGAMASGGVFRRTIHRPGAFPYHCRYHPTMRGILVVR